MTRLVAYRTSQAPFLASISRISDTFLIYQAERKRKRAAVALRSVPLMASAIFGDNSGRLA